MAGQLGPQGFPRLRQPGEPAGERDGVRTRTPREDKRLHREREVEEARWCRERSDRCEQWYRKDQARWLAERRVMYADYLLGLDMWADALISCEGEVRSNGSLSETAIETLRELENDMTKSTKGSELVRCFWLSTVSAEATRRCCVVACSW